MMMNNTPDMFKALKIAALARYSKTTTLISHSLEHGMLVPEDEWRTTVAVQKVIEIQRLKNFKNLERALIAVPYFFHLSLF
jgi:hypothetical protein